MRDIKKINGQSLMESFSMIDIPKEKAVCIEVFGTVCMAVAHRRAHETLLTEWNAKKTHADFLNVSFDNFVQDRENGSAALRWQDFEYENPDAAFYVEIKQKEEDFYKEHQRIFEELRVRPGEPGWRGR